MKRTRGWIGTERKRLFFLSLSLSLTFSTTGVTVAAIIIIMAVVRLGEEEEKTVSPFFLLLYLPPPFLFSFEKKMFF
jgi:hypothetical protein